MRTVRSMSMKTKLTLFAVFFLFLPLTIFVWIWYEKSTNIIEANAVDYNKRLIRQLNSSLDRYFTGLKAETLPLITHPLIQQFVKMDPKDTFAMFQLSRRMKQELYPSIVYGNKDIYSFSIFSRKGGYFTDAVIQKRFGRIPDLDSEEELYKIMGISVVNQTPVITVYRKIIDSATYQVAGAIYIDVTLNQLLKIAGEEALGKTGYVTIADAAGRYLYHPDEAKWGTPVSAEVLKRVKGESGHFIDNAEDGKKMIVYHYSEFTDLTMITEVPLGELIGDLIELRNTTLMIVLALMAFSILAIVGFSLSITRPLFQLLDIMKKVERGDLDIRASQRSDEFGIVNRGFNRMLDEIKRLIEVIHVAEVKEKEMEIRQRESLLQALQSRINPHFLYNTLEVINSYAIIAKVKPISQVTVRLAGLLRYSVSNPKQPVLLQEEIGHLHDYIMIQQERYEGLEFQLDIDPAVLQSVYMFRLILQPIVENAFIHGYEKQGLKPTFIAVAGERNERYFAIKVTDRGGGMLPRLMDQYNEAFAAVTEKQLLQSGSPLFQEIGLWNVHSRLRIAFGPLYGLAILKSDETGTDIEIRLPYISGQRSA